jgi:hypothetical protein
MQGKALTWDLAIDVTKAINLCCSGVNYEKIVTSI